MRIWSFHPSYLDSKGLVALWRETLLAKNVLSGNTKGYLNHPQLSRFKNHPSPTKAIDHYLQHIFKESKKRGYNFDKNKFSETQGIVEKIKLTSDQLLYEFNHLKEKLKKRDPDLHDVLADLKDIKSHPLFTVVKGRIESWEKLNLGKN